MATWWVVQPRWQPGWLQPPPPPDQKCAVGGRAREGALRVRLRCGQVVAHIQQENVGGMIGAFAVCLMCAVVSTAQPPWCVCWLCVLAVCVPRVRGRRVGVSLYCCKQYWTVSGLARGGVFPVADLWVRVVTAALACCADSLPRSSTRARQARTPPQEASLTS